MSALVSARGNPLLSGTEVNSSENSDDDDDDDDDILTQTYAGEDDPKHSENCKHQEGQLLIQQTLEKLF